MSKDSNQPQNVICESSPPIYRVILLQVFGIMLAVLQIALLAFLAFLISKWKTISGVEWMAFLLLQLILGIVWLCKCDALCILREARVEITKEGVSFRHPNRWKICEVLFAPRQEDMFREIEWNMIDRIEVFPAKLILYLDRGSSRTVSSRSFQNYRSLAAHLMQVAGEFGIKIETSGNSIEADRSSD